MSIDDGSAAAFTAFELVPLEPGDIVFVYDGSRRARNRIIRFLNVVGQRLLAAVRAHERIPLPMSLRRHSHVMLGLGNGLVVHADGKKVSIDIISDYLRHGTDDASMFEVYRRRDLSPDQAEKIVRSAVRYYNQKYRFSLYHAVVNSGHDASPPEDNTQFCSRLVASAYRSAGKALSSLPDHGTLPVDLHRVCQSDEWVDISSQFRRDPNSSIADLAARTNKTARDAAASLKRLLEAQYKIVTECMGVEEAATRYCIERFKATKMIEAAPHLLPDDFANQIERVLQQIEILLDVASLPTLDSRIPETALNKIDENAATGLYAEIPPPIAVWEMQRSREIAIICTCLLMAQIGLFAVLAQLRPYPGLEKYEGVERRYVEQFALRIPTIQNLERYGDASNLFNWIDEETERNVWRAHFMVIIRALGLIASIRAGGVTEPRG